VQVKLTGLRVTLDYFTSILILSEGCIDGEGKVDIETMDSRRARHRLPWPLQPIFSLPLPVSLSLRMSLLLPLPFPPSIGPSLLPLYPSLSSPLSNGHLLRSSISLYDEILPTVAVRSFP
jgi:hypothetical protein